MTKTIRFLAGALFVSALGIPPAARADSACLPDAQKFCAEVPIGEGRVLTCLRAQWANLAGACQREIQKIENRAREVSQACANDIWQYCPRVLPGHDRIRTCLWSRWKDLSSTCKDEVAVLSEKAQKLWDHCTADIEALCPGMQRGGGQIYLCLKAQESKASHQCRQALR
jgi:hypothetical protein